MFDPVLDNAIQALLVSRFRVRQQSRVIGIVSHSIAGRAQKWPRAILLLSVLVNGFYIR